VNKKEVAELLVIISGLDRFQAADRIVVEAWSLLPDIRRASFTDAQQAVIDHFTSGNKNLSAGDLNALMRRVNRNTAEDIAADVRSARARGLVSKDWNERDPIPDDVRARLTELREESRRLAPDLYELEAGGYVDIGEVGRRA
jgi:hypothetical protein